MMSLASAMGSVVKGAWCCRVTGVRNRSAAWRMGKWEGFVLLNVAEMRHRIPMPLWTRKPG